LPPSQVECRPFKASRRAYNRPRQVLQPLTRCRDPRLRWSWHRDWGRTSRSLKSLRITSIPSPNISRKRWTKYQIIFEPNS